MSYKGSPLTLRSWQYPVFLEVNKVEALKKITDFNGEVLVLRSFYNDF